MALNLPISRSLVVSSSPAAVADVYKQILPGLQTNNFSDEDIFSVHLALEEAFINAVRHGNKLEPTKAVKIDYAIEADKIEICMTDEGPGFDPEVIPDPRYGDNLYKPAGRGMLLMRSFMDVVEYSKKGNSVRMIRYREKRRPRSAVRTA
ncbi:MAG: ATP-binding protein [Sedimentisphaerales bacterium]|nr:ATP-binding protein [Sedimentisphaerales bacterium]